MNNLETDKGTKQLVASEASAGTKGGGDDSANACHASRKEGTGDLSSGATTNRLTIGTWTL